ncbi:MAG TPA: carbon-nitrogen hydrolase family protein [Bryobacteraceae bacterium]|nr:carbon-nitrogen hydrolase family protein [Bryobacteraceae bacterium]
MKQAPRAMFILMCIAAAGSPAGYSADAAGQPTGLVKVAAIQIKGYDKGDLPRQGYDPAGAIVPYIDRAGKDGAQLAVFPEYVLGHIRVPGPATGKISAAAAANHIYVIVGGWEDYPDGTYADTAFIFDRSGRIAGKYLKTHAAVDHYEGDPPWSKPPGGKDKDWFLTNDPEWLMKKGGDLPVFDLDFGKVGIEICYDGWFPEPARVLSLRGAELIVWINGRTNSVEDYIVKSVMFQSHVAMITSNQSYGGGTMIGDVGGGWEPRILAHAPDREEAYISAAIDLGQVRKSRAFSRDFQQRRPDLNGELVSPIRPKY